MDSKDDLNTLISKYISTKDEQYIIQAIRKIMLGTKDVLTLNTDNLDYLFYKDTTNNIFLQYILSHDVEMTPNYRNSILKNGEVLKQFLIFSKIHFSELSEEDYTREIEPGVSLIEYLFQHHFINIYNVKYILAIPQLIECIKKYNKLDLLPFLDEDALFLPFEGDKTVIEYLFEKRKINPRTIKKINKHPELYDLINEYNRDDLTIHLSEELLNMKRPNKDTTILDEILSSGQSVGYLFDIESYKTIIKHKEYDLLIPLSEEELLLRVDGNKTILEILLENGVQPYQNTFFSTKESFMIIYNMRKFDMIGQCSGNFLLDHIDLNKTYLEAMLEGIKEDDSIVDKISGCFYSMDREILAKVYMLLASKDLISVFGEPDKSLLVSPDANGKRLINELLKIDRDVTIKKLISDIALENLDILLFLRINGVKMDGLAFGEKDNLPLINEYYENKYAEIDEMVISQEAEDLLNSFRNIMLLDGKSNPKYVELLIRSYRRAISLGNNNVLKEVELLIEVKKNNPDFIIQHTDYQACYDEEGKSVNLSDLSLNAANHETGHAMFDMLTDKVLPPNYVSIVEKIRKNPEVIEKIAMFTQRFYELREKAEKYVDEVFLAKYEESISPERKQKIEDFLAIVKVDKMTLFKGYGYSEEELEAIVEDMFTYEEYIRQDKAKKRKELARVVLDEEYPGLYMIADIIDSIFEGKYVDGELFDKNGKKIEGFAGHGGYYYTVHDEHDDSYAHPGIFYQFHENIANISAINKSTQMHESFDLLRSVVGEEFVTLMVTYYREKIIESKRFSDERSI